MRISFGLNFWRKKNVPFEHEYCNEVRIWIFEDWEWKPLWAVGPFNAVFTWLFISVYADSKAFRPLYRLLKRIERHRGGYDVEMK